MRFNLSSGSFKKYLQGNGESTKKQVSIPTPTSIEELLDVLNERAVTGNEAKELVRQFLIEISLISFPDSGAKDQSVKQDELLEAFYRCLDRNLKVGVSHNIFRSILQPVDATNETEAFLNDLYTTASIKSVSMPIALAHSATPKRLENLSSVLPWFISRKLDGVRCLVVVSVNFNDSQPQVTRLDTLSRSGQSIQSLLTFRQELAADLNAYPRLGALCKNSRKTDQAQFVIDGELCALQMSDDSREPTYVENFAHTLSVVRRQQDAKSKVVLFPFDFIPIDEFVRWKTHLESGNAIPLRERLSTLRDLVDWCLTHRVQTRLRDLEQIRVNQVPNLDQLLTEAVQRHWEGLVIRADVAYEGKRTTNMLKLRQTQDAEYLVLDAVVGKMRLPVDGVFQERLALSQHRGVRVSAGSGFSVAQRLEYGAHPERIKGKAVTVAYYQETETKDASSLRFPVVKGVYDSAKRTL
ncbi:hypothetical protein MPSI1_001453 [Malassezia psittaci]|uniref:ATP-dependent DNA ligase family profile domain-containing protein n=1 Tax=Malassezia psittaci TaxID=1821823 RepID=A0AAF0FDH0_9BASI|nr:hypothetical protein MPSI1_001453 [Malassezia psittaci]